MAISLVKLLAIPALLARVSQSAPTGVPIGDTCPFTTVVPDNAYYQEGSDFVLAWNPDNLPPGTINLVAQSSLAVPILTGTVPIYDYKAVSKKLGDPNIEDRAYTWPVEIIGNATGSEYVYLISGYYTLQYNPPYGSTTGYCTTANFHVSAAP
ncbi:hypothetical protein CIB48_g8455 [Xylaria polymorpha]|nr:hypothetical protein CIB48_g8455 [Xylaria polymorpha]